MKTVPSYPEELETLQKHIRAQAKPGVELKILEAGCGREWFFDLNGIPHEITGVDFDRVALDFRKNSRKDLHNAIVGDLRSVDLPAAHYDVVYCSFVLEHIDGATRALDNMRRCLKPGGLLIIRVPDLDGFQTFMAKRLPHQFAIFYYRHAWGIQDAGKPGFAPYRAFYDNVISLAGFRTYCRTHGMSIVDEMGVGSYRSNGHGILGQAVSVTAAMMHRLSAGRVHDRHVNLTFVARTADATSGIAPAADVTSAYNANPGGAKPSQQTMPP